MTGETATWQPKHPALHLVFRAAAEATEEAVLGAMLCADTVTGFDGSTKYTLRDFAELFCGKQRPVGSEKRCLPCLFPKETKFVSCGEGCSCRNDFHLGKR